MLLYYAMGGGLGHLTRARAFLHTLGLSREATLFTASPRAGDRRVVGDLPVARVPASLDGDGASLRAFLEETAASLGARRVVVDAFPAGLLGELAGWSPPAGTRLWHVARLLRWDAYSARAPGRLPRYDVTWEVEPLDEDQRRALVEASGEVRPLDLVDPPEPAPVRVEPPYWLVVHGGGAEETADLVCHARELLRAARAEARIVLASPERPGDLPGDVEWVDAFPAAALFAGAERIVSAAGFNVVRQAARFREKHFVVPYPRALDDQFARAARARAQAADRS